MGGYNNFRIVFFISNVFSLILYISTTVVSVDHDCTVELKLIYIYIYIYMADCTILAL